MTRKKCKPVSRVSQSPCRLEHPTIFAFLVAKRYRCVSTSTGPWGPSRSIVGANVIMLVSVSLAPVLVVRVRGSCDIWRWEDDARRAVSSTPKVACEEAPTSSASLPMPIPWLPEATSVSREILRVA